MGSSSTGRPRLWLASGRTVAARLVLLAVAAVFVRTWVAQSFSIPSGSMEPSLQPGDFVLVDRFAFGPALAGAEHALLPVRAVRRGDVVVARLPWDPRRHLVKRVVGLPGETVTLRGATVYIDGMPLDEPCLRAAPGSRTLRAPPGSRTSRAARPGARENAPRARFGPVIVPPRHYFVLGDNRRHSQDSRLWGALPHDTLAGRVVATYWSSAPPAIVAVAPPNVAAAFRRRLQAAARFLRETRWSRVLRPVC